MIAHAELLVRRTRRTNLTPALRGSGKQASEDSSPISLRAYYRKGRSAAFRRGAQGYVSKLRAKSVSIARAPASFRKRVPVPVNSG